MSNSSDVNQYADFTDKKKLEKNWLSHKINAYIIGAILILIGFVLYLQVCGAECSGSDPSGFTACSIEASNNDGDATLTGSAAGTLYTLSIVFLVCGLFAFMYSYVISSVSKKLVDENLPYAAVAIDGAKGKSGNLDLLAFQVAELEKQALDQGIKLPLIEVRPEMRSNNASDDQASSK